MTMMQPMTFPTLTWEERHGYAQALAALTSAEICRFISIMESNGVIEPAPVTMETDEHEFSIDLDSLPSPHFELVKRYLETTENYQLPLPLVKPCAVCDDKWETGTTEICAGCNVAVHQTCYGGIQRDKLGRWFCHRCLNQAKGEIKCAFCSKSDGVLKPLDAGGFVHCKCAIYIPELSFSRTLTLEPVRGNIAVPDTRFKLRCCLCKEAGGACIECSSSRCTLSFHVMCAWDRGLLMGNHRDQEKKYNGYCPRHLEDVDQDAFTLPRIAEEAQVDDRNGDANAIYNFEDYEPPEDQYCICQGETESNILIECSIGIGGCNSWVHPECVGLSPKEARQIENFVCPACQEVVNNRKKRPKMGGEPCNIVIPLVRQFLGVNRKKVWSIKGLEDEPRSLSGQQPVNNTSGIRIALVKLDTGRRNSLWVTKQTSLEEDEDVDFLHDELRGHRPAGEPSGITISLVRDRSTQSWSVKELISEKGDMFFVDDSEADVPTNDDSSYGSRPRTKKRKFEGDI
jgi:hypothetical protein